MQKGKERERVREQDRESVIEGGREKDINKVCEREKERKKDGDRDRESVIEGEGEKDINKV